MTLAGSVFAELKLGGSAASGSIRARSFTGASYFVGIDDRSLPCLLVRSAGQADEAAPVTLSNLSAVFAQPCRIELDGQFEEIVLSTIKCTSDDERTIDHFLAVCDSLVEVLGTHPTAIEISESVERLVSLFLGLLQAPTKSWTGVIGELAFLDAVSDVDTAVEAWRPQDNSRFDFVFSNARLEAKATTARSRRHMLTFEQANPIAGSPTFFSSVFVEYLDHGTSVASLIDEIARRVHPSNALKLGETVASTLGHDALRTAEVFIDLELLRDSIRFYAGNTLAAIRDEPPVGVSRVSFESDFSLSEALTLDALQAQLSRG